MEDRVPNEAREEPSEPADLLESGRRAIRKEAGQGILLGGGIVFLHLILLGAGVLVLRSILRSILFVIGLAVIAQGIWEIHRARNLTLEDVRPTAQEKEFAESLKSTTPLYTCIILACLIAVGICQPVFKSKNSIEAAGLVKSAVRLSICFVGVVGLIGFAIIDNAAHLGGLIGGAICGAVMIKKNGQTMPVEVGAAVKVLGIASLLAIAGISLFSILKILHI